MRCRRGSCRLVPWAALVVCCALGLAAARNTAAQPVLFSPEQLSRARERAERHPWARAAIDQVLREAESWCAQPAALPEGEPGLYHDYFCPDHGVALQYAPDRPKEHRCPVDGRLWRGPKLDAYWVHLALRNRLASAVQCALAAHLSDREALARAAARILLEHAAYYRDRIASRTPRRWMAQSLDEAVCILDAAKAFDLVSGLTPGLAATERRQVVEDYLLPTAKFLLGERRHVHNIDCWYNAAVAAIAAATGDKELLARALGTAPGSRFGLRDQLREGVSREGFWKEGSVGYHFYTLAAVVEALQAARGLAAELESEREIIRSMFLAPLALADARGLIPPNNDSLPRSLGAHLPLYERGAGLFPADRELAGFLARAYGEKWRTSLEALLFGPEHLPEPAEAPAAISRSFPDTGFAVLRTRPPAAGPGNPEEVYLLFDFGPHGGYHGHLDKLAVALHGLGRAIAPDLGTAGYSLPLTNAWYRQTLSHNTVVVDRKSQRPASGKLLSFCGEGPVQHAVASTEEAVAGLVWTRGLHLTDEGIVVVLDRLRPAAGKGRRERTFDWTWQAFGELTVSFPTLQPVADPSGFGTEDGYPVARSLRSGTTSGPVQARWRILPETPTQPPDARPGTGGMLRLWLAAAPRSTVFVARVPGNPIQDALAKIVVRRCGEEADFAAVLELVPEGAEPQVRQVQATASGLEILTESGRRTVMLPEPPPAEATPGSR
ncbi:MAG: heparinase II/III-family protein [Planctomycetes bacterium]|nr:heparinase II/III-family protein [Planctomycetota bacterium]